MWSSLKKNSTWITLLLFLAVFCSVGYGLKEDNDDTGGSPNDDDEDELKQVVVLLFMFFG